MTALWITEADVARVLTMTDAVGCVRDVLRAQATGRATPLDKALLRVPGGAALQVVGGHLADEVVVGTKTWCYTPNGAQPLITLLDATDGHVLAVIEAFALGQLRTGAASAIATDQLARTDAREMALIGTGRQALPQAAAVANVRTLQHIRVFGRDAARREQMAERIRRELRIDTTAAASVEAAVDGADVVTLVTRAERPVLLRDIPAAGTHINAVGAVSPERSEFEPAILERCDVVSADDVGAARRLAWELQQYYGTDDQRWSELRPLGRLVADGCTRPDGADLTVFKSLGLGLSDLAMGLLAVRRAREHGAGAPLPGYAHVDLTFRPDDVRRAVAD